MLHGPADALNSASRVLVQLYGLAESEALTPQRVHLALQESGMAPGGDGGGHEVEVKTRRGMIRGRGPNQQRYLASMQEQDLVFGIGPAGTGKTYLAVASAVQALEQDEVRSDRFVSMYVNDWTRDYGEAGRRAGGRRQA